MGLMITDARSISPNAILKCDLCIVGAGAAGITLALQFVQSRFHIVVLESGGETLKAKQQALNHGKVMDGVHPSPHLYRLRRLGGSTASWGGRCVPLDEQDFRKRSHVPLSGWPFDRSVLRPFYERAQILLEAGVFDYSASTASPRCGALVEGLHDPDIMTDSLERFCLVRNFWRRYRAELAKSDSVNVIKWATCLRLSGGQVVTRLECASASDARFEVQARYIVLAVGGLEVVRVLGHSGYGNHSGMLGRTYMCHIEAALGKLRLSPAHRGVQFGFDRTNDGIYSRRRFTLQAEKQERLRILNGVIRLHHANIVDPSHRHPVLSGMFLAKKLLIPQGGRNFTVVERKAMHSFNNNNTRLWLRHIHNMLLDMPQFVHFGLGWISRRYLAYPRIPHVALPNPTGIYPLDFNGEQAPNLESFVSLADATDRYGVPRLKIDWRPSELDWLTLSSMLHELKRAVEGCGCGTLEYNKTRLKQGDHEIVPLGGHHIGTTRMSDNPKSGVVNSDGRVHYVRNLYVAGSSTFPTSGASNPMLTIVAMALRLAQHLEIRLDGPYI
jgi:choline dehydrogenase-like flavoprotein